MAATLKFERLFFLTLVIVLLANLSPVKAFADSTDDDTATDYTPMTTAMHDVANKERQVITQYFKGLKDALESAVNDYKESAIAIRSFYDQDKSTPPFLDPIITAISGERVKSQTLAQQIQLQMANTTSAVLSGEPTAEDASSDGDTNPINGTSISNEAALLELYNKQFCIPESLNATDDCKAQKGKVTPPYENFIDFFISNGTWQDQKILDVLLFARRFYAGASDKILIGQGALDAPTFMSDQEGVSKANLRMAILNDLAAQRAPSSEATSSALNVLFRTLMPAGDVGSTDYSIACPAEVPKSLSITYACSFTAPQGTSGKRLISQAALDRIMQFDYPLSSNFYKQLNSSEFPATGSIDKVNVYLKAQQLAQDYRALRLLQMKVAATAMNMMNNTH